MIIALGLRALQITCIDYNNFYDVVKLLFFDFHIFWPLRIPFTFLPSVFLIPVFQDLSSWLFCPMHILNYFYHIYFFTVMNGLSIFQHFILRYFPCADTSSLRYLQVVVHILLYHISSHVDWVITTLRKNDPVICEKCMYRLFSLFK